MKDHMKEVQPEGWSRPKGYRNGIVAEGKMLFVAGQIGWDASETIVSEDFVAQFRQALINVRAVVEAAGAEVDDVVRLTMYATDLSAYRERLPEVGAAYREVFGRHFPVMALVGVADLVEAGAQVEIEATAVLQEKV